MVPMARALIEAGHEVEVASASSIAPLVEQAGLMFRQAGLDPFRSPPAPADGLIEQYNPGIIGGKTRDLLGLMRESPSDVVVREPTDFAGLVAAEAAGLPHLTLGRSHFIPLEIWRNELGGAVDEVRAEVGLPPDPALADAFRFLYLDMVPPWFQPPEEQLPATLVSVQPSFYDGVMEGASRQGTSGVPVMRWLADAAPVVYVTMGSWYNHDHRLFQAAVDALAGDEFRVICTVGWDQDPSEMGTALPPNFHFERYVPQSLVLPYAQAVVCHGGYSTVVAALCAGVPVLIVPHGSDHMSNAIQCENLGVGLTIPLEELIAEDILLGVRLLRDDLAFRRAALELAEETKGLPGLDHAVQILEHLPALAASGQDVASYSRLLLDSRSQ